MRQETEAAKPLDELARSVGLLTTYADGTGQTGRTPAPAIEKILRALGVLGRDDADAATVSRDRTARRWRRGLDHVVVAWVDQPYAAELCIPETLRTKTAECELTTETGATRHWKVDLANQLELSRQTIDERAFVALALPLIRPLATGYHDLTVRVAANVFTTRVICAPKEAYRPSGRLARTWGLFAPLYALHDGQEFGVGDLRLLAELRSWAVSLGASTVGTLPLLPTFLDRPFDPSPYSPVTRLFWNELYVDPRRAPEFDAPTVQAFLSATETQREIERLRGSKHVDYRGAYRLKREILRRMRAALPAFPDRRRAYEDAVAARPDLVEYARFRVAVDERGAWRKWEPSTRIPGEPEPARVADYAYAQFLATEQIDDLTRKARREGLGLYLDFPIGVHPDGYDAWKHQDLFIDGLTVGAPPDRFFTSGQNWGFAPLHPDRLRESRYTYFIRAIRNHCETSGVLRIDHVMGLHRLFVIPRGSDGLDGAYLHYPALELYAILCLESHRTKTTLVGEDLGAVPSYVRPTLRRHGIHRMSILQGAVAPDPGEMLAPPPPESLASLNTHDMPPFASFWESQDIPKRMSLGLIDPGDRPRVEAAKKRRETVRDAIVDTLRHEHLIGPQPPYLEEILRGCLAHLARSPARMVSVNVEDLWLEQESQNLPGTSTEHPNWTRKLAYPLPEIERRESIQATLRLVDAARRPTVGGRP